MKNKFMKISLNLILIVFCTLILSSNVVAQSHYAADVSIQTITVEDFTAKYSTTTVVHSGYVNGADDVELKIILPFPVVVWSISGDGSFSNCSVITSENAFGNAYVLCELGDMDVDATKTVQVTTLKNQSYSFNRFSAFVSSTFPDPDPSNNFAWGEPIGK